MKEKDYHTTLRITHKHIMGAVTRGIIFVHEVRALNELEERVKDVPEREMKDRLLAIKEEIDKELERYMERIKTDIVARIFLTTYQNKIGDKIFPNTRIMQHLYKCMNSEKKIQKLEKDSGVPYQRGQ